MSATKFLDKGAHLLLRIFRYFLHYSPSVNVTIGTVYNISPWKHRMIVCLVASGIITRVSTLCSSSLIAPAIHVSCSTYLSEKLPISDGELEFFRAKPF
jgi:hypothetical protein